MFKPKPVISYYMQQREPAEIWTFMWLMFIYSWAGAWLMTAEEAWFAYIVDWFALSDSVLCDYHTDDIGARSLVHRLQ